MSHTNPASLRLSLCPQPVVIALMVLTSCSSGPESEAPMANATTAETAEAESEPAPAVETRLPCSLYTVASGGSSADVSIADGVIYVAYLDDLSGEHPRRDADGAVKSAERLCSLEAVAPVLREVTTQADTFEVGDCRPDGDKIVCAVIGNHDAPSWTVTLLAGEPLVLESIVSVSKSMMSKEWTQKASVYLNAQMATLASTACP